MTDEKPFELKLNNDKYVTIDELTKIDLAGTKPIDFVIGNNPPVSVKFWRLLLSKTVDELIKLYPHKDILHFSSANTRMLLFSYNKEDLHRGELLSNGLFLETCFSSNKVVELIKAFFDFFGYKGEYLLNYRRERTPSIQRRNQKLNIVETSNEQNFNKENINNSFELYDKELIDIANVILEEKFSNAFRLNSNIAKNKFRRAYFDLLGKELIEEFNIDDLIKTLGVVFEDKVYIISSKAKDILSELINEAIINNNNIIYYKDFYDKNSSILSSLNIFNYEILKKVIQSYFENLFIDTHFFKPLEDNNLVNDLVECFKGKDMLSIYEIKNKLLYTDINHIKRMLQLDKNFVFAKRYNYMYVENLSISTDDVEESKKIIEKSFTDKGTASLSDIVVNNSINLNYNATENALREAIFIKCLSNMCDRNRSILYPKGKDKISGALLMEEYCLSHNKVTVEELEEYENKMTGHTYFWLIKAMNNMIRVDQKTFVSFDLIEFDIEKTNEAIGRFIYDKIVPFKKIDSFIGFPEVEGYIWNKYLLASFCLHVSNKYNSWHKFAKNDILGGIYPNTMEIDSYNDFLYYVVLENNIPLTNESINLFLKDNGYIKKNINTDWIISKINEYKEVN
ncbi:MAG: hypothetical protein IJS60_00955 [Abditibacteriota bacterium]|nr:hypothetical protein [Abditibacteriota bacterium]